jgi:hypothetical protein
MAARGGAARLGCGGEVGMSLRPFLSHARADQARLNLLKSELSIAGADGWQDVEDLRLGHESPGEIRQVIRQQAGGFLWLGTPAALTSRFINRIELPTALARARRERFPVVPIFADVTPSGVRPAGVAAALAALGVGRRARALSRLATRNGILRDVAETDEQLFRRSAAGYVRHALLERGPSPVHIAMSCRGGPIDRGADLVIEWSDLVGPGRQALTPSAVARAREVLTALRGALEEAGVGELLLAPTLWLPLAVMTGRELGMLGRVALSVEQHRQGATPMCVGSATLTTPPPLNAEHEDLAGSGPAVVSVAAGGRAPEAVAAYCRSVGASRLIRLETDATLEAEAIGGLAHAVSRELDRLNDQGHEKHLLIRGPVSLAALIGVASNPTGRTVCPLWDGQHGYLGGVVIGEAA